MDGESFAAGMSAAFGGLTLVAIFAPRPGERHYRKEREQERATELARLQLRLEEARERRQAADEDAAACRAAAFDARWRQHHQEAS